MWEGRAVCRSCTTCATCATRPDSSPCMATKGMVTKGTVTKGGWLRDVPCAGLAPLAPRRLTRQLQRPRVPVPPRHFIIYFHLVSSPTQHLALAMRVSLLSVVYSTQR